MDPMFLKEVEGGGHCGDMLRRVRAASLPLPRIWHLFAFKPEATRALSEFIQAVMRGPSPLPAGMRELIAAFTSRRNQCVPTGRARQWLERHGMS